MDPNDLTPAERRVWQAFPTGAEVDFRKDGEAQDDPPGEPAPDDPAQAEGWGPERTVRAEVLRALLLSSPAAGTEVPALRVSGARIRGVLNLQYGTVAHPVRLMGCHFERTPNVYGAQTRQLNLSGSFLPGLRAATLRVEGVLRMTGCRVRGEVRLGGARITGALFLDGAHLGAGQGRVLQLNQARIDDDLWAPGLRAEGMVRLSGAQVAGAVNLEDAVLRHAGDVALDAENLVAGAGLRGRGLQARGQVEMRGAKITGQLDLTEAGLSNPGGVALRATSCTIGELWLRRAAPIEGTVNLRRSQFDLMHATPEVWPEVVRLDGLTYGALSPRLPARERLALLERDEEGYVPHAYEQLAAAYRRVGDDAASRTVQLARQRRHRRLQPWYARIWGVAQDVTVGYGYRPVRAAAWLLVLLAIGTVAFALHHPPPAERGKGPDFNPFIYTLNLLLPIVDFGQAKAFNPKGAYQWLSYGFIAAGWILATTIVAGVTRAVSRQ
ncbi:hypothetical protein ACRYCC_33370 [Actinomadura scrupuli]|uniref:hypothetical protein n=1 Tax=Actinomadura scrupuli TaxID=559629 RepID=UPI003D95EBCD